MKKLIVVPQGGLCNRLRVVLSSLAFSRTAPDCNVRVEWGVNNECRAAFSELFEPFEEERFRVVRRRWWNVPQSVSNFHWPAALRATLYDRQLPYYNFRRQPDKLIETLAEHDTVYVSTCFVLAEYEPELLQKLRVRPDIQTAVDELTLGFGSNMIGVHIRRTDNKASQATSTDDAFREAMHKEVEKEPGTLFFLATDDIELKSALQREFPGRIMMQHLDNVRRDTLGGMRQAVIDLFCLSKTNKILGSFYSSFSETAAEIGSIPLIVVGKENMK